MSIFNAANQIKTLADEREIALMWATVITKNGETLTICANATVDEMEVVQIVAASKAAIKVFQQSEVTLPDSLIDLQKRIDAMEVLQVMEKVMGIKSVGNS